MDKLYAIQDPDGVIVSPGHRTQFAAWRWHEGDDAKERIAIMEKLGYRCVEVEVVKKEAWK